MTDHIHKSYANGTKVDLYIQTPSSKWTRAIPVLAFIAIGLMAWSKVQSQQTAYLPPVHQIPGTPWYVYVGIIAALIAGLAMVLLGGLWLFSYLMSKRQEQKTYTVKLPKQEPQPEKPAEQPKEVPAVAKVIPMKRKAS